MEVVQKTVTRKCYVCDEVKPLTTEFFHMHPYAATGYVGICRVCKNKRAHNVNLSRYGIDVEKYAELLVKQNGVCAVCGNTPKKKRLAVDHNHKTGKIRGLLCEHCNQGLGHLRENIEILQAAIKYLEEK